MKREEVDKKLFNEISDRYAEKDIYPVSRAARAFQVQCLMDFLVKEFQIYKVNNLIEVGCGHGANSEYLKTLYTRYLGIDYSEELVKIANERYSGDQVKFATENIKAVSKYGSFDVVIGIGILHHIDDLEKALQELEQIGHEKTVYLFYEPQNGNPFIQLLRSVRMKIDPSFSSDQVFFEKEELKKIVQEQGFRNVRTRFNGYLTPPLAQVMLKPTFIFMPLVRLFIKIDKFLFRKVNSKLAWNFMIGFTK